MKRLDALAFALLLPLSSQAALSAQATGGSVTMQIKTHLPDSVAALTGTADMDMLMTMSTDGERFSMDMQPQGSAGPSAGMHIKMIFTLGGDSVQMGILMPELAATTGMPGMRIDMPISMMGSANAFLGGMMDSISKTIGKVTYRSLKSNSTVAGISCAEWEMINDADTTRTCVIPTPPELTVLQDRMNKMTGMKDLMGQLPGVAAAQRDAYGGKAMTAIRTTNAKAGTSVELISFVSGKPDAAIFELPAGLQPMPMPGKPGGAPLP